MPKRKKQIYDLPNSQFIEALSFVLQGKFRRINTIYIDTIMGNQLVSVYRISDNIVRAEMKELSIDEKHKIKKGEYGKTDG
jgi:hypothetical protein